MVGDGQKFPCDTKRKIKTKDISFFCINFVFSGRFSLLRKYIPVIVFLMLGARRSRWSDISIYELHKRERHGCYSYDLPEECDKK